MAKPIHIIYIPGFGSRYDPVRKWAISKWRFKNVTTEIVQMHWQNGTFRQKIADINQAIENANGKNIVLIGESAGGSMIIHMMARRPELSKFITLCGKNTKPETVSSKYLEYSPAFRESMKHLNESLASLSSSRHHSLTSIHPIFDNVVPVSETLLSGCKQIRLPLIGHLLVIIAALTIFSPILIKAARN